MTNGASRDERGASRDGRGAWPGASGHARKARKAPPRPWPSPEVGGTDGEGGDPAGAMFVARSIAADHKDLIHDVSFDFHGRRMATCSSDQSVKVRRGGWLPNPEGRGSGACAVCSLSEGGRRGGPTPSGRRPSLTRRHFRRERCVENPRMAGKPPPGRGHGRRRLWSHLALGSKRLQSACADQQRMRTRTFAAAVGQRWLLAGPCRWASFDPRVAFSCITVSGSPCLMRAFFLFNIFI